MPEDATPTPAIDSVSFVDPWGTVVPGTSNSGGVQVGVSNYDSAPSGTVLVGRLVQGGTPIAYSGSAGTAGNVTVPPPGPLTGLACVVQVQWAPFGVDPSTDPWADGVSTAPVVTEPLTIVAGTVSKGADGWTLAFAWESTAGAQPAIGVVQIYDVAAKTFATAPIWAEGASASLSVTSLVPTKAYAAYAGAQALLGPGIYTVGPLSPALPVPVASPAVTAVSFDGARLSVRWTAPPPPASPVVASTTYSLVVVADGVPAATFGAGAGGGAAALDLATLGTSVAVAGMLAYGPITGPLGTPQAVPTRPPAVSTVTAAASGDEAAVTVTLVAQPSLPSGTELVVELLLNGTTVQTATASGTPPTATVTAPRGTPGYAVRAYPRIPGTQVTATGPATREQLVVTGPVTGLSVAYDGSLLHLSWNAVPDPAVTGYAVAVTGVPQGTFATGPEPVLSVPVRLAVGAAVTAVVTPLAGIARGIPAQVSWSVPAPAAPAIVDAALDGDELTLAWSPSAGPWLDGYAVTLTGTAGEGQTAPAVTVYTGLETSTSLRLPPQDAACAWTATVAARAAGTSGPASAAVKLFPAQPVVTKVTVAGTTATVGWALTPSGNDVLQALEAAGARVQVLVLDADNVVAAASATVTAATGSAGVALPSGAVTRRLTAAVWLVSADGTQTGSRSAPAAVLAAVPAIAFGALLDGLSLRWSASGDAGVTGYTVSCGTASVTTSGTEADLVLLTAPTTADTVTVTPVGADSAGPPASRVIVSSYGLTSGTYDGATLNVALSPAGPPTPANVWVDVLVDGAVAARATAAGDATTASVPVALAPGTVASVRATGVGAGALTVPSGAVAVPTSAPAGVRAAYDGTALHVAWTPVRDPGVTGYVVTVTGVTGPAPTYVLGATASSASVTVALSGAFPGQVAVEVRACAGTAGGGRFAGPVARAVPGLAGSVRAVAAAATAQPPFVYRRGVFAARTEGDVTIALANVFAPATPTATVEGDTTFTLAPLDDPVPGGPAYRLTIAGGAAWGFAGGDATRPSLRKSYCDFLAAVETCSPAPGGIALVRQAVATALPQTFDETLYYRYGLWREAALRVVDLDPGMRLRVSGAAYQAPLGSAPSLANGYVVVGGETYDLGETFPVGTGTSGLAPALTVDALLARLFLGGGSTSTATVAAGPEDFFGVGGRQAYYRLFYPKAFPSSGGAGSTNAADNVAVVGAATWTVLENVTSEYARSGSFTPGAAPFLAYFRGRAMLTPLVAVEVDGDERWVPVGTTLREILSSLGAPALGSVTPGGVSLTRAVGNVYDSALGGEVLRADPVDLSGADLGDLDPQLWPLDLPVLGGDRITVAPWAPAVAAPG